MKLIVAAIGAPQPSQRSSTTCPSLSLPSSVSGTKKRALIFCGGSKLSTGLPAATHSPSRYSTSAPSLLHIGQLRGGPLQLRRRLFARGAFAVLLQHEGRRVGLGMIAALQVQLGEGAGDRAGDAHVVGFGVTGVIVAGLVGATGQQ